MARKRGTRTGNSEKADWKGFVSVRLSNTEHLGVLEKEAGDQGTNELLTLLCSKGYKVSMSPLQDGSGYCCSVTGKDPNGPNAGLTMSSFASSPRRAVLAAWYKCAVKCGWAEWGEVEVQGALEL